MSERLSRQLAFIVEVDKVKTILRRTRLFDGSRRENDAEHSWHLSIMAMVLAEHANAGSLDLFKVVKIVLIHDLVEIDAGDIAIYDSTARADKRQIERKAAQRIFGLLPDDQRDEMAALWEEFEARESAEAKFAAALDRVEPILQNYLTQGYAWKKLGVSGEKVRSTNEHIKDGSEALWEYVEEILKECLENDYFGAG